MKIELRVKPGANETRVEKQPDGSLVIKVKERAQDGKANQAVIETVADYFDVPKQNVQIVRGHTSRNKLIEIRGLK